MKTTHPILKIVLLFIILSTYSFATLNPVSDAVPVVKKNGETYLFLAQKISFRLNKTLLDESSKKQLFLIAHYLRLNKDLKIEVGVHNDIRTKEDLSQTRAEIIKDFLTKYGASNDNIDAKGYNVSKLLNDCTVAKKRSKCTEREQQANRRVELKITNPSALENYTIVNSKTTNNTVFESTPSVNSNDSETVIEAEPETITQIQEENVKSLKEQIKALEEKLESSKKTED